MIRRMHDYRDEIENGIIADDGAALTRIFDRAEKRLASVEKEFTRLALSSNGNIAQIPENIAEAQKIVDEFSNEIEAAIVRPGKDWAKGAMPRAFGAGRNLARVNLDVDFISPELVSSVFKNVSGAEKAVLEVGFKNSYRIMNVVGDDVGDWFRREMLDAVIDGIPVQGGADSLAGRLIQSGRIKPLKIKTQSGRIITRTVRQRANTIARVEMARVVNQTHEVLATEALGDDAVYINSNPRDSRTTDICLRASAQPAMTLRDWDKTEFGRPPRLNPFHMCRSVLIGGEASWFGDRTGAETPKPKPKPKPTLIPPKFKSTKAAQTWANDNIKSVSFGDFKGVSLEVINDTISTVAKIEGRVKKGIPIKRGDVKLEFNMGKIPVRKKNILGVYQADTHTVTIRKQYNKRGFKTQNDYFKAQYDGDNRYKILEIDGTKTEIRRPFTEVESISDIVTHEMAHALDDASNSIGFPYSIQIRGVVQGKLDKNESLGRILSVSEYGSSDVYASISQAGRCHENFAESFLTVFKKSPRAELIDPEVRAIIDAIIED